MEQTGGFATYPSLRNRVVIVTGGAGDVGVIERDFKQHKDWLGLRMIRKIWFTAADVGLNRPIYAVTLGGRERLIAWVPGP